jgi:hypothetical protein
MKPRSRREAFSFREDFRPPSASSYGILGRAETVATRRTGNWFLAMVPGPLLG